MICEACRDRRHGDCRGGSWCDCQHQPSAAAHPGDDEAPTPPRDRTDTDDDGSEPGINWLRQG